MLFKTVRPFDDKCLRDRGRLLLSNVVFRMMSLLITPERLRCVVHNFAMRLMIGNGRWERERMEKGEESSHGGLSSISVTLRLILFSKEHNSSLISLLSYYL